MLDHTQARIGSLLAMGGREMSVPASESKMERSHLISAMEDSRRLETFRKSAVVVIAKTWRRRPLCLHLRTSDKARSRFLDTSVEIRRRGRS